MLAVLATLSLLVLVGAEGGPHRREYVPALTPPTHLVVACLWAAPERVGLAANETVARAEVVVLESLAGLLLRHGSPGGVGLYLESNVDGRMLLHQLAARRGVTYEYRNASSTPLGIARELAPAANVTSFVSFDAAANPQSTNVARMVASLRSALMVDRRVVDAATAAGFAAAVDVSARDDLWALEHLLPTWPHSRAVALEQSNALGSSDFDCVNDIATAFGALSFGSVGSGASPGPHRDSFLSAMTSQGLVIGWPSYNEVDSVPDVSAHDKLYVVCEMSRNLALLSSYRGDVVAKPLKQKGRGGALPAQGPAPKHYVAFHFTDGDNIEWIDGQHPTFEFYSAGKFWDARGRGTIPLAWGLPTLLSDFSATVLEMLYDTATAPPASGGGSGARPASASGNSSGADVFVAVSPVGYGYVSKFSPAMREANAAQQGLRMAALDMNILNLVDYRPTDYVPQAPRPAGQRPVPPCPAGWWTPAPGKCEQGCPSGAQGRDPATGRCLCGKPTGPDAKCLPGFDCIGGQCHGPKGKGPPAARPGTFGNETFADVYGPYARQPAIDALFLYPWDTGYEGNGSEKGSITWVEGKPVITGRVAQWLETEKGGPCRPTGPVGHPGCRNTTDVANLLNSMKPDLSSSDGYSLVPVNVWTSVGDVKSVLEVVAQLGPHIEVVAADVFVKLITANVKR
jgi:hypothetical protein